MEQIRLEVDGMTCQGCVGSVTRVLEAVPGVASVEVSLERKEAVVRTRDGGIGERLVKAIEDAGFEARIEGA